MSGESYSTNMNLPIPGVGVTDGPTYASDVNTCLTLIDSHDHSSGFGVQITPAGLDINSDLSFGSNNATTLRSARFSSQNSALALATDLNCVYVISGNLYYNNNSGTSVQITNGSSLAGAAGTISGLPYGTASASYNSSTSTFVWQSATNKSAYMDCSSILIRNFATSSYACTLAAPGSMSTDQTITLPTIPVASSIVMLSNTGTMSPLQYLTASNIASGTITTTQIASATITGSNIASGTITTTNIASSTITGSNIAATTIDTGNLATNCITTVKITDANVTRAKLASVGQQVSSSSGSFTSGVTGAWTDITNLSISITTTGRPVIAMFQPRSAGNSLVDFAAADTKLRIYNTSTGATFEAYKNPQFFSILEAPAAGTYTYKVQFYITSSDTVTVDNAVLAVYEL